MTEKTKRAIAHQSISAAVVIAWTSHRLLYHAANKFGDGLTEKEQAFLDKRVTILHDTLQELSKLTTKIFKDISRLP